MRRNQPKRLAFIQHNTAPTSSPHHPLPSPLLHVHLQVKWKSGLDLHSECPQLLNQSGQFCSWCDIIIIHCLVNIYEYSSSISLLEIIRRKWIVIYTFHTKKHTRQTSPETCAFLWGCYKGMRCERHGSRVSLTQHFTGRSPRLECENDHTLRW